MANGERTNGTIWKVIGASSVGTMIEWYDFYIFGSLATTLAPLFFPKDNPTAGLLSTLATFATGFVVRPFGAIVFGRLGDIAGRKITFLVTLLLMGGSTFAIGLLPTYAQVGALAPALLVLLRLLQGLALGGEYGGAATYVAEHAPDDRKGYYTSFIQTTATLGLFVSLGVILGVQGSMTGPAFDAWGWRVPFLLSAVLVVVSYFIRTKMAESPLFARLKASGKTSRNPLKESFANPENRRLVLIALFGATAGQGVVWYTGQFYALTFLQSTLKMDKGVASQVIAIALLMGTPLFLYFGSLSDRIGRKKIIIAGCVAAAVLYVPIYMAMTWAAGWNGTASVNPNLVLLSLLVLVQVVFVTMVYGPIAAFLVELFPTRIRYTSMSVPYHIGNGIFGGLVPLIATALAASTGNMYMGLAYPITIALLTAAIGARFIKESSGNKLWADADGAE
ncbi:MAG: MHS family MFS transporter [Fimbriimonadaceae bacterium]|nr:MHS family MFS transporter [Fimbriimonadaceae bacterium]